VRVHLRKQVLLQLHIWLSLLHEDSCIKCARANAAFNWQTANLLLDVQTNTNIDVADDLQMQFAHHRDHDTTHGGRSGLHRGEINIW